MVTVNSAGWVKHEAGESVQSASVGGAGGKDSPVVQAWLPLGASECLLSVRGLTLSPAPDAQ